MCDIPFGMCCDVYRSVGSLSNSYSFDSLTDFSHTIQNLRIFDARWKRLVLLFLFLFFLVLLGSYALRTSAYLTRRIEPKLATLGEKLDGEFRFKSIEAMGFSGIVMTELDFVPNRCSDAHCAGFRFNLVTVYPDLLGMFFGDLDASLVEVRGMRLVLNLDKSPASHLPWIDDLKARYLEKVEIQGDDFNDIEVEAEALRQLPRLRFVDSELAILQTSLGQLHVLVPDTSLKLEADFMETRRIELEGQAFEACHLAPKQAQEICVKFGFRTLTARDVIEIEAFQLSQLKFASFEVLNGQFHKLSYEWGDGFDRLSIDLGSVVLKLEENEALAKFAGLYPLDFGHFEVLMDQKAQRLGIGIGILEKGRRLASFYGGFDLPTQHLAMRFESNGLDLARFLDASDLKQRLPLKNFPVFGHLNLRALWPEQWYSAEGTLSVRDAGLEASFLSREALSGIHAEFDIKASYNGNDGTAVIELPRAKLGKLPFEVSFVRLGKDKDSQQISARLSSRGESGDFINALPKGFAPLLSGYRLSGPYGIGLNFSYNALDIDALELDISLDLDRVVTKRFDPRSDFELLKGNDFMIRVNAATIPTAIGPRDAAWVPFDELPRDTAYVLVASEDGKFFSHAGVDLRAIRASLIANLKADKVVRGGSTISQQVVKNLFLNHDKTLARKFQEAFLTWQMEKTLPKIRIFELYFNLAHWAKDVYGIRGAAKFYFDKSVSELSLRESLFLASILPNPVVFGGQYLEGNLSPSRYTKMMNIGKALRASKRISKENWDEALDALQKGKITD